MLSNDIIKEKAQPWLKFLEDLANIGIDDNELPIPQIAVFGDQSSGKSSLLESISGIPFPKGTGLVTRCPTRISMTTAASSFEPWRASITLPATITIDSTQRAEIEREVTSSSELSDLLQKAAAAVTARSVSGFSSDLVAVAVSSSQLPNLSLVDLPGIVRTTTAGQSPLVIEEVNSLLRRYMMQPETVILVIIPSAVDIATVDCLERAAACDPKGERTIGVLTKPDLVDRGAEEEVLAVLRNERKPLKLGYVLVKNRGQAELTASLSSHDQSIIEQALQGEQAFFDSHPVWGPLYKNNKSGSSNGGVMMGIPSLTDRLSQLLVSRAMARGPALRSRLADAKKACEARLTALGAEPPVDDATRRKLLVRLISRYSALLRAIAAGDYRDPLPQSQPRYRLKLQINSHLSELQDTLRATLPDVGQEAFKEKLAKALGSGLRGRELPGFGSTRLLLSAVADELDTWKMAVEDTAERMCQVYEETAASLAAEIASSASSPLAAAITSILSTCLGLAAEQLQRRVDELFVHSVESASLDTQLVESINTIRFARFDGALKEALTKLTPPAGVVINNTPTTAASNVAAPPAPPAAASSTTPAALQQQAAAVAKTALRAQLLDGLGAAYMSDHAFGRISELRIEEARAALSSYWRLCEKKMHEDISAAADVLLLQRCGERIESELLAAMQLWMADPRQLHSLFTEEESTQRERQSMLQRKQDIEKALMKLEKLQQGVVGVRVGGGR